MWVGLESCRGIDIRALERLVEAGVAKLGQRRWDEVPVSMSSQVRILPSALFNQDENLAHVSVRKVRLLPSALFNQDENQIELNASPHYHCSIRR